MKTIKPSRHTDGMAFCFYFYKCKRLFYIVFLFLGGTAFSQTDNPFIKLD